MSIQDSDNVHEAGVSGNLASNCRRSVSRDGDNVSRCKSGGVVTSLSEGVVVPEKMTFSTFALTSMPNSKSRRSTTICIAYAELHIRWNEDACQ